MKVLFTLLALTVGFAAHADYKNCILVDDSFQMPMIDDMSGLTQNADGTLDLLLALAVPNPKGGSNTSTISAEFKNASGKYHNIYKKGQLTMTLEDRSNGHTTVKVTGTAASDWSGKYKVDVIMTCESN